MAPTVATNPSQATAGGVPGYLNVTVPAGAFAAGSRLEFAATQPTAETEALYSTSSLLFNLEGHGTAVVMRAPSQPQAALPVTLQLAALGLDPSTTFGEASLLYLNK